MDKNYLKRLDLMVNRLNGTDDVVLPIDGDEGQGKTEFAVGTCYYMSYKTGRKYGIDNIFFDLDEMIKFASKNKEQIIHFDEAVLGLLATNWQNKLQQKFIKLVMVARKKKHFIVLCIPKFHRLPPYMIEERALGLVHVYSRKNIQKGRFCYFTKKKKDTLYEEWKRKKIKTYRKNTSLRGSFVKAMEKVFTKEQIDEYERKKDEAIEKLGGDEEDNKSEQQKRWLKQRNILIAYLREENKLTYAALSKELESRGIEISTTSLSEICTKFSPPSNVNNKGWCRS